MNDTAYGRQMGLGELTDLIGPERVTGLPVGHVRELAYDSRKVRAGTLFFAIPGMHVDGHEFAASAAAAGALAVVVERELPDLGVPQLIVDGGRRALADAADAWFGRPSQQLEVIGITGTDGKTTTGFLATAMLLGVGRRPGLLGTVALRIGDVEQPNEDRNTTPEALELQELLARMERRLGPGITEIGLQREVHDWVREAGWKFSWDEEFCPMVNFGQPAFLGHAGPTDRALEPGDVIHVDVGLIVDGFASDLQRTWYLRRPGESEAPPDVKRTFAAVKAALDAGVAAIKPGARGFEVDAVSRSTVEEWDFPEPGFAFGHGCGRVAHDGSGVLGPEWERYGDRPRFTIREGNVFAVEMDLEVPGYGGLIGLEEEVVVTPEGAHYLSVPQRELSLLG